MTGRTQTDHRTTWIAGLQCLGGTPRGVLAIAFVTWALAAMDQSLFGYAVPGMMAEFDIGIESVGLIISVSFLFGMVIPILVGVLADNWGPRLVLFICLVLSSVFVFMQGVSQSVLAFGAYRVLSYGLSGALAPITSAMVANTAPNQRRAFYISILQSAYPFGWFIAALAVVPLAGDENWRAPFAIALFVIPVAVVIFFALPPLPAHGNRSRNGTARSTLGSLFSAQYRRLALLSSITFFLYGGAVGGIAFFLPTFFQDQRGYTPSVASTITGLTFGIAVVGYLGAAFVSQRLMGPRRTTITWSLLGATLLGVSVWLEAGVIADVAMFGVTAIFFFGTSSILTTYLLELFPAAIRTTAMAVCGTTALTAGYIVFPTLVSACVERIGWAMSLSLVIVPACFAASVTVMRLPEVVWRSPQPAEAPA